MNGIQNTEQYINTKSAKEISGVSIKTLRIWDKESRVRTIRTLSGQRRYNLKDLEILVGINTAPNQKKKICYCRVSSHKQMDDLKRQEDFFRTKFPHHELVTDVGSGINWKRKGLRTILERSMRGDISEVVVAHRDRLCRFAFELLEWIFDRLGVSLMVLDKNDEESSDRELSDDILSIIHVYSCRKMGRRRYTQKIKENKNLSQLGTKEDIKEVDGDKKICV